MFQTNLSINPNVDCISLAKDLISKKLLTPNFSDNIHAVGIGFSEILGRLCIQVFLNKVNQLRLGQIPMQFNGFPIVLFEMTKASFIANALSTDQKRLIEELRSSQTTIIGGLSGANNSIDHTAGTIGYFCRPKREYGVKNEVYLLSCAHVFANFDRDQISKHDLIAQPSPAEIYDHRPIAKLKDFSPIRFENSSEKPNYLDAAVAKLFPQVLYQPIIPGIGKVSGVIDEEVVKLRTLCRKVGRTTGYTEGKIVSVNLDIWIHYARRKRKAFFKDQILIQPTEKFEKFVSEGDSGSLAVNNENKAVGLIFAGVDSKTIVENPNVVRMNLTERLDNCAVANPMSRVLKEFNVELIT